MKRLIRDTLGITYRLLTIMALLIPLAGLVNTATAQAQPAGAVQQSVQAQSADPRYFAQTGFRIDDDHFWDYFNKRGGLRTFGYPVSRKFTLMGSDVQIFQRRVMQIQPGGGVGLLNLLDPGIMPYTTINYATLPAPDVTLTKLVPTAGSANYYSTALNFIKTNSPDTWNGLNVGFDRTYNDTVHFGEAYPDGKGDPNWMAGINLEMWGMPTSAPAPDPNNSDFVYLRFQRGIMHFDVKTGLTQGLLIADYFKSIITGNNLPGDLAVEAKNSPFYKQYNNANSNGLNRPDLLPATNMKDAFEPQTAGGAASPAATPAPSPAPAPAPAPGATNGFRYGMQAHMYGIDQPRAFDLVTGAGFGWLKQQITWNTIEPSKGQFNWGGTDEIVNNAQAKGANLLFSVVAAPAWAAVSGTAYPANPQDFADFMSAMAGRYKGRVQAYEIWNEENFAREVGAGNINAGNYVELLKAAYPVIKAADPNAIVVSGAPTPTGVNDPNIAFRDITYLQQMYQYQGGEVKNYFDALGAHNEPYWNPPDQTVATATNTSYANDPSFFFRQVEDYRNLMVQMGDGNKQIWETEIGYDANSQAPAAYAGWTVSDQQQATYLVQLFQYARANYPWMGAIFVWNLNFETIVPQTDEKWGFGIINPDWTPRPAYAALQAMQK